MSAPTNGENKVLPWTEEQRELQSVVRRFVADKLPESDVRARMDDPVGYDPKIWQQFARDLGVGALAVPEHLGGTGYTPTEVGLVAEELGRSLACLPFFSTVALAESLLLALDGPGRDRWLEPLCHGELTATVAFAEVEQPWDASGVHLRASLDGNDRRWRLDGSKTYVVDGHTADLVLVLAQTDAGLSVFAVDGTADSLVRTPLPTMDQTRKQARLDLAGVAGELVGDAGAGAEPFARMLASACTYLSMESVGGAQRVLEMSVEHAKTRFQFGRPIGSFQAIKHKCADMLLDVESAKSAAYHASQVLSSGDDAEIALSASLAKAFCQDAFARCSAENIQVHGGMGFTWEHSAHLYFKRAKANQLMFGSSDRHLDIVADCVGIGA